MDTAAVSYMLMLETLSVTMIMFLTTYIRSKTFAKDGGRDWKSILMTIVAFSAIGLACNHYVNVPLEGVLITPRDFIIMFSTFVGGPVVGLPTALVLGGGRLLIGGVSAPSIMISVLVPFLLGTLQWYLSGKKFPGIIASTVMMFLSKIISLGLIGMYAAPQATDIDIMISSISVCTFAMLLTCWLCKKWIYDREAKPC